VILLAVGWYLRFSLSYREVEELLAERALWVDHVTVWRWVQRYTPELQRKARDERGRQARNPRRQRRKAPGNATVRKKTKRRGMGVLPGS
jgi:transposase-like protein